jgi:4-diphosphocytidyl-2-C-methyl-D-erythritol kinase
MRADAFAKVNLSLRVGAAGPTGLHEVDGLFQSIDWSDTVEFEAADEDVLEGIGSDHVIDGWDNLVWRALDAARERAGSDRRFRAGLRKAIPVAAGLGGGSADAAAALGLAGRLLGLSADELDTLAPALGSDVPFCLRGGLAHVSGTGGRVSSLAPIRGFALALVVPPIEVATGAVYDAWDRLSGPRGPQVTGNDLPPGLRDYAPLGNDLHAAAVAVAGEIEEWRAELATRWERPVMLTGSGPTLFAYFVDAGEAEDAVRAVPVGARATRAASPVNRGWQIEARQER